MKTILGYFSVVYSFVLLLVIIHATYISKTVSFEDGSIVTGLVALIFLFFLSIRLGQRKRSI